MRTTPWLLLLPLLASCAAPGSSTVAREASACVLDARPELIAVPEPIAGEVNEFFELPDTPEWWAPAPWDAEREQYRAALVARLGGEREVRARALLERQRDLYAGNPGDMRREVENSLALLVGKAGSLGPASCLEWRLFQRQARRFPMLERPTEFGAYVLRGQGRIRVYLSGADRVGMKLRGEVSERVAADVARGFVPVAHLHNHPFLFDREPGDRMWTTPETVEDVGGTLAPSLADVNAYRQMREYFGLRGAWVTNGLDTGRFTAEDFDRLSAWP
ncbi:MAG TPA: hypothetical protein VLQ93_06145 [Myxococcaceae bacterium]|nr:hypothetical protein [Myxococcaceae bacterium]